MRLHVEVLVSVHNCRDWRVFHVMSMEEDQAAKLSAVIRDNMLSRLSCTELKSPRRGGLRYGCVHQSYLSKSVLRTKNSLLH